MIVWPPFQVFVVVGVVYCMIKLLVDLRQADKEARLALIGRKARGIDLPGVVGEIKDFVDREEHLFEEP